MEKSTGIIPIENNKCYYLFKRGSQEHIKALYEEGEIYISSIDTIRNCDDNYDRSDADDSIKSRVFSGDAKVKICDIGKNFEKDGIIMDAFNLVQKNDYIEKGNIYCLTGIYSEHLSGDRNDITFDTKSFGESIIFIQNPRKFLERVSRALVKNGYSDFRSGKVEYYNNDFSGSLGFFCKHERFKPQSEFRIFIPNHRKEPIKIKIGSMKDIANLNIPYIKLKYTDDREQQISL